MVSVCIATFNGEKFIAKQIESILCQLSEEDEIIVSDDFSTDSTCDIVLSFHDARIRLFRHVRENNVTQNECRSFYYACENFGYALSKAKGDVIFLSDQDDIWCPYRKEEMMKVLEGNVCAMCNYAVIDGDGHILDEAFLKKNPLHHNNVLNALTHPFLGCCMAFRREALEYILPIPEKCIAHDLWIGCLCNHYGTIVYLDKALHQYRMHESNVSPTVLKSKNSTLFKMQYRCDFLILFFRRLIKMRRLSGPQS